MKGLLCKDVYLLCKYCRSYLLLMIIFAAASVFSDNSLFQFYPCILFGLQRNAPLHARTACFRKIFDRAYPYHSHISAGHSRPCRARGDTGKCGLGILLRHGKFDIRGRSALPRSVASACISVRYGKSKNCLLLRDCTGL